MKIVVALISVCIFVSMTEADIPLNDEQTEKLTKYHNECLAETKADAEFLKKLLDGVFPDDQKFKEYLLCISKGVGFQDKDGKVQKDVIIAKLTDSIKDASMVKEVTEKCITEDGAPTDIVYKVLTCIFNSTPNHVGILV